MTQDHFTYRVTWSPEDGEHVGLCAEFPSLSWLAATPEGALAGIRRLVADVVRDMTANGERCPNRSPTEPIAVNSRSASRRRLTARW